MSVVFVTQVKTEIVVDVESMWSGEHRDMLWVIYAISQLSGMLHAGKY